MPEVLFSLISISGTVLIPDTLVNSSASFPIAELMAIPMSKPLPMFMALSVPDVPVRDRLIPFNTSPAAVPPEVRAILRPLFVGFVPSPVTNSKNMPSTPSVVVPRPEFESLNMSVVGADVAWFIWKLVPAIGATIKLPSVAFSEIVTSEPSTSLS